MVNESSDTPVSVSEAVVKTLLLTDLVESTALVETLGDERASAVSERHDRVARDLLVQFNGIEIDKTDGFLFLFDRPIDAVRYALSYHDALVHLSVALKVPLAARAGIHLGEVVLRRTPAEHVSRGAKPIEVEGLAKPTAARIMSLAAGGQTLLTRSAFDMARRAAVGHDEIPDDIVWMDHGPYLFKGVEEPQHVSEAGRSGRAPLSPPLGSEKVKRAVAPGDEDTLGWRPAVGLMVPGREGWKLEKKLGEGGFGEVWNARHVKSRTSRAFKFCFRADRLRSLKRELTLFRLMREVLGDRQDIARLYEVQLESAPYFLEMEYSSGGDLTQWCEQRGGIGEVSLEDRLEIVAQVADALGAAHSVGVIHKDVKPTNVLIEAINSRIQARLTDFGIGQLVSTDLLEEAGVTATGFGETDGQVLADLGSRTGTRLYMAPELHAGKPATIQSDIYALGVLLFQILSGDLTRPLAQGWEDSVEDELLREDIAACIAGIASDRLPAADALSRRLRTLQQRRLKRSQERAELARQRRRRRLLKVTSVCAVVLFALASVAGVGYWQTDLARRKSVVEKRRADVVNDFLNNDLLASADPWNQPTPDLTVRDVLDRASETIGGKFADQPLVKAAILATLGKTYRSLGVYDRAEPHLRRCSQLRQAELGERHPDTLSAMHELAWLYQRQGRFDEAEPLLKRTLELRRDVLGEEHRDTLASMHACALLIKSQGRYDEAEPLYKKTVELSRRVLGERHPDTLDAMNSLALLYRSQGQFDKAEPLYLQTLELRRSVLGDEHPATLTSMNNLAMLYQQLKRYDEAEPLNLKTVELNRKLLGEDHPNTLTTMNNLALLYEKMGRYEEAEPLYVDVLARRRRVLGAKHPNTLISMSNLGSLYERQSRFDEAEPLYAATVAAARASLPDHHWHTGVHLSLYGALLTKLDRCNDAEAALLEADKILEATLGPNHQRTKKTVQSVIELFDSCGKPVQAKLWREKAGETSLE